MRAWGTSYSKMIDPRTLLTIKNSSADGPSPALLELRGKRYVVADEITTVSPEVLKRLLGGGKTTARGLHQDPVEVRNPCHLCPRPQTGPHPSP